MSDWANALMTGLGAAAQTGAGIIGDQMKQQQQIEAEQRAADTQLDLHERMAAADDMMKNRALERYASIVKTQAGVQVPQEADSVDKTGITREAGKEAGEIDVGDGTKARGSFNMSKADLQTHIQNLQRTLDDPNSTDEQRADAKGAIAVMEKQIEAQKSLNEDAVDGKMRPRTTEEAVAAANDYALQNDPTAFVAGTKAYNDANKDDIAEKKLAQQLTLQRESGARAERMAQLRSDTMLAKLGGGAGGKEQANIAQVEYLMTKRGLSQDQALALVYGDGQGLAKDPASLAVTLASTYLSNGAVNVTKDDPPGTTKASKAMQMAMDQVKMLGGMRHGTGMLDSALPGMPAAPGATMQPDPKNPLGLNLAPRKGN